MRRVLLTVLLCALILSRISMPVLAEFKPVSNGSEGDTVYEIQERLVELGYLYGNVDGSFGQKTENAVIVYQAKNGIEPTGVVDEKTYNSIMGEDGESVSFGGNPKKGLILMMTSQQLLDYSEMLTGFGFDTVVKLDYVGSNYLGSNENGSKHFISYNYEFYIDNAKNLKDKYSDDQTVEIVGTIEEGSLGGASYKHCEVVSEGSAAESRRKEIEKSSEQSMRVIEAIRTIKNQKLEKEQKEAKNSYIEQCDTLDYERILRNPDSFKGDKCKVHGTVLQVSEGWFGSVTLRVAQNDDYDRVWYVTYSYNENEDHILEDDWVTVYGECQGTETYTALLGNKITIPEVKAKYIVFD